MRSIFLLMALSTLAVGCGDKDGDDTGGVADDTSSGDDTGASGDDTGASGDDTGASGDDTGASGDDTGAPSDLDGDGYSVADGDCDDADDTIHPGAAEICADGIDQDCDGAAPGCQMSGIQNLSGAWRLSGVSDSDGTGRVVTGLGDVDGDGHRDLAVSDTSYKGGYSNGAYGGVWVVSGPITSDTPLSGATASLMGDNSETYGGQVVGPGDVNGDGYDDILVAGPYDNPSAEYYLGAAWLIYGPVTGDMTFSEAGHRMYGDYLDYAGEGIAAVGDLNEDGYMDLAVGAPGDDDAASGAGAIYVLYGPVGGDLQLSDAADNVLNGNASGQGLGYTLAAAGDVDGDGDVDLLAAGYDDAWLIDEPDVIGNISGADSSFTGFDYVGGIGGVGDLNGDGYGDVALGDRNYGDGGAVWVYLGPLGGSETSGSADVRLDATGVDDYVGWAFDGVGDMDGDGMGEMLVGAPDADSSALGAGTSYLIYGSELPSGTASLGDAQAFFPGSSVGDSAGDSVAGPGDLDGDGVPDLLIGGAGASAAWVVPGVSF